MVLSSLLQVFLALPLLHSLVKAVFPSASFYSNTWYHRDKYLSFILHWHQIHSDLFPCTIMYSDLLRNRRQPHLLFYTTNWYALIQAKVYFRKISWMKWCVARIYYPPRIFSVPKLSSSFSKLPTFLVWIWVGHLSATKPHFIFSYQVTSSGH